MTQVAVIVNPTKLADADSFRAEVTQRCTIAGHPEPVWFSTTADDPGPGMVAEALDAGASVVLACGGDGTVTACAGALAETGAALAIIPLGTGNLLARNLDLPLNLGGALAVAFGPGRRRVDVLDADGRRFAVMAGLGFDAALIRDTDEDAKARVGWLAYLGGLARAVRGTPRARFEVSMDGGTPEVHRGVGVLIGNVGELQGGIQFLPQALPDDGRLDVIVLAPRTVRDWPVLLGRVVMRRSHNGSQARILSGRSVTVTCDRMMPVEYDGEFEGEADRLSVRVMERALELCVPQAK
jgi:diacylglycerol kinase family enzyme